MNDGVFLGSIPQYVRNSILNHELPNGKWSNIVKALEKGDIKGGVLNGVKFDGAEVKIGSILTTPIAYYQGDDGEIIDRSDWVVCGFNGAVPEYVKYIMNGTQRVFVKATDDANNERAIVDDDPVYTRKWNNVTNSYDYQKIGTVQQSVGVETFTYGATNADYGTIGIKDPYSVPKSLIVEIYDTEREEARSLEATFAGYNMQLWSKHAYLDADAAGSYEAAKVMMTDSKQCTTMAFIGGSPDRDVDHNWESSCIRGFLNGESNLSGYLWTNIQEEARDPGKPEEYEIKHTFIQKVAMNEDALMQSICRQVNRNWTPGDNIVRTIDTFWLPGTDLMKSAPLNKYILIDELPDSINGLCEEREMNKHLAHPSINGCTGTQWKSIWVRSASSEQYYFAVWMDSSNIQRGSVFSNSGYFFGFSPACSIG